MRRRWIVPELHEPMSIGFRDLSNPVRRYLIEELSKIPERDARDAAILKKVYDDAPQGEKEAARAEYVRKRERALLFAALPLPGQGKLDL